MASFDLDRFVDAQEGVYDQALAELVQGHKRSHWIWFVFPQIAGLGHSATAQHFALAGTAEARAFLRHPVLSRRLFQSTAAMLEWADRRSAESVLGPLDATKFRSSVTLFELAAEGSEAGLFTQALERFFDGERDPKTLELAASSDT